MDLSIIIVSWNTREILDQCLDSVERNPPGCKFDIWVVDNASSDGSPERVRERYPAAHLIECKDNVGFARANNLAIEQSEGEYVLLLNPDTVVYPGTLTTLMHFIQDNPGTGGVGPRLLNPDGSLQGSCFPFPTLSRELWRLLHLDRIYHFGTYNQAAWDKQLPRRVDVIQGACLLLRRSALNQVGLLNPDYFMYTEEVDLCYRLQQAGWEIWWVPQAEVVHYGGQSTHQVAGDMFIRLYETKILFFRTNYGHLSSLAYKGILYLATLIRLAASPIAWLFRPASREQNRRLARHYTRLLQDLPGL